MQSLEKRTIHESHKKIKNHGKPQQILEVPENLRKKNGPGRPLAIPTPFPSHFPSFPCLLLPPRREGGQTRLNPRRLLVLCRSLV